MIPGNLLGLSLGSITRPMLVYKAPKLTHSSSPAKLRSQKEGQLAFSEPAGRGDAVTGGHAGLAGSNGGRDVNSWVTVKEICCLKLESDVLHRHHREVLYPDCMRDPKAVPYDRVIASNRAVLQ